MQSKLFILKGCKFETAIIHPAILHLLVAKVKYCTPNIAVETMFLNNYKEFNNQVLKSENDDTISVKFSLI